MLYPSELRGHVLNSTVWLRKCTPRFVLRGGYPPSAIRQPISIFRWREPPPFHLSSISFLPATEIRPPGISRAIGLARSWPEKAESPTDSL